MTEQRNEPCGVLLVNKHAGVTSHDIVGTVRRLYHTRRVGHTGTLDPMATGVLVVLIGRATKAAEYLLSERKTYLATLRLGITTDTGDITGAVTSTGGRIPSPDEVQSVLPRFTGEIQQIPPMYSALKIGGRKLVDLARQGKTVEREARTVTIDCLNVSPTVDPSLYNLEVRCSGGTYIRTLCEDIGSALGCGGTMASLCRIETGGFPINGSHTIEELSGMDDPELLSCLLPLDSLFRQLPSVVLQSFHEKLIRGGCAVAQEKLKVEYKLGTRIRLLNRSQQFFALGEVVESENSLAVKAIKTFVL